MNCSLSKEKFCEAINSIEDYWNKITDVADTLGVVLSDSFVLTIIDEYLDTLCEVMGDEPAEGASCDEVSWILYYCWDLNFGKEYRKGNVTIDGEEFPLYTPEGLYNLLIKLYWTEED